MTDNGARSAESLLGFKGLKSGFFSHYDDFFLLNLAGTDLSFPPSAMLLTTVVDRQQSLYD